MQSAVQKLDFFLGRSSTVQSTRKGGRTNKRMQSEKLYHL